MVEKKSKNTKRIKRSPKGREIKLVAIDMDGTTLLDDHMSVSVKTRETIEKAIAKGIQVVPATGRAVSAIPESVLEIPGLEYAVTSNGAFVSSLTTGETIVAAYLEGRVMKGLIEYLAGRKVYFEVFYQGRILIEERLIRYRPKGWAVNAIESLYQAVRDVGGHLGELDRLEYTSVEKIIALNDNPKLIEEIHSVFMKTEGITCSMNREETLSLEVTRKGVSKASGMEKLCAHLGIDPKDAMAVGDNGNDLAMIRLAGIGIAMGNGTQELKEAADYVTLPNLEDGLAMAMEKFLDLRD